MSEVGQSRVAVLLGAGASKDAGLKLSAELTEELQSNIAKNRDEDLRRALGLILGAVAFKRSIDGDPIDGKTDIEVVLRIAQQLAGRNDHPLASFISSWNAVLEQIAPGGNGVTFRRLISRAREILAEVLKEPSEAAVLRYLAAVHRLNPSPQTAATYPQVFTLNYDRCLERGLSYEAVPFTTGFLDGRWEQGEFDRTDCVRVYKLHGSFGWIRHPETNVLYDRDQALGRADIDIASYDTEDELVFGTDNKLRAVQPFLWMAYRLSEAVAACKYVVVIGYGFADSYINQIISQGMASDPTKWLVAVGPTLTEGLLERATDLQYLPERFVIIPETARSALFDSDSLRLKIRELDGRGTAEGPF